MTEIIALAFIFALLIAGVGIALKQHERDLKRGTVTDPERSALWWGGIILVMVLSAYGVVDDLTTRGEAQTQQARR